MTYLRILPRHLVAVAAYIAIIAMCGVISSCGSDNMHYSPDEEELIEARRRVYLTLDVALQDNLTDPSTRAEGEDGIDDENYFEDPDHNCEKLQTLRVIIVKHNDTAEGDGDTPGEGSDSPAMEVEYNRTVKMRSDGVIYDGGSLRFLTTPGKKTIYLIGNEAGLPDGFMDKIKAVEPGSVFDEDVKNEIANYVFDSDIAYNTEEADNYAVPMSEIFDVNVREVETDADLEQTATLFITRALSKFSFQFKTEDGGSADVSHLSVKKVKISGLGKAEYVFPKAIYDPVKGIASTYPLDGRFITSFELPSIAATAELNDYEFYIPEEVTDIYDNDYVYAPRIYFPESKGYPKKNAAGEETGEGEFYCSLSFDGENYIEPVTLPNLSSLPRNTHVKVIITLTPKKLLVRVEIEPYTVVKLRPVFGDDKDEDSENKENSGDNGGNGES